jgi:hypothetical protein
MTSTCNATAGGCVLEPRVCDAPSDPVCFESLCDPVFSCFDSLLDFGDAKPPTECVFGVDCSETECSENGNATFVGGEEKCGCDCFNGYTGVLNGCYVPPCDRECLNDGVCEVVQDGSCNLPPGTSDRDVPADCWLSVCKCPAGFDPPDCTAPEPIPPAPVLTETTVAVGASVLVLIIAALAVLAFVLWRMKKIHSEIAELDAFANASAIGDNPLYDGGDTWKVNAMAD